VHRVLTRQRYRCRCRASRVTSAHGYDPSRAVIDTVFGPRPLGAGRGRPSLTCHSGSSSGRSPPIRVSSADGYGRTYDARNGCARPDRPPAEVPGILTPVGPSSASGGRPVAAARADRRQRRQAPLAVAAAVSPRGSRAVSSPSKHPVAHGPSVPPSQFPEAHGPSVPRVSSHMAHGPSVPRVSSPMAHGPSVPRDSHSTVTNVTCDPGRGVRLDTSRKRANRVYTDGSQSYRASGPRLRPGFRSPADGSPHPGRPRLVRARPKPAPPPLGATCTGQRVGLGAGSAQWGD
jgi:hypothetical protein